MANRPIFIPDFSGKFLVITKSVDFPWYPGLSVSQKKRSVKSLHESILQTYGYEKVLEISTKSENDLGVSLSAFNLSFTTFKGKTFTVESAYQSSKVFLNGGPYKDIIFNSSIDAKRDPRIRSSGPMKYFDFFGDVWELEPKTALYNWVYLNALWKSDLALDLDGYEAFTDIEFNPEKSINCQAYSVAMFVSLVRRGIIHHALSNKENFLDVMKSFNVSTASENSFERPTLGL